MHIDRFEIAQRFCGPPRSGNGGYVCGLMAKRLNGAVTARLKAPPPLCTALRLESSEEQAVLYDRETIIGEARVAGPMEVESPPPPSYQQARQASPSFLGFKNHRFPGCFVCGPQRKPLDGLRIFPGPLEGTSTIAAPWTPDASLADESGTVRPEFLWSALDCSGGFSVCPLPEGIAIVLGELSASIHGAIRAGDECVVTGWPLGVDGRKRFAGSAVFAPGGHLVALARAVWIDVPAQSWA